MHKQGKNAVFGFELIISSDFITECGDGTGTVAMSVLCVLRNTVFIKGHSAGEVVADHDDELGLTQHFDFQKALLLWQLFTGMDGILDGIGQCCGQFTFVGLEGIGKGKAQLEGNTGLFGLLDINRKNGIKGNASDQPQPCHRQKAAAQESA